MKYFIWLIDEKTGVPKKSLETEDNADYIAETDRLIRDEKQFATRVEK